MVCASGLLYTLNVSLCLILNFRNKVSYITNVSSVEARDFLSLDDDEPVDDDDEEEGFEMMDAE